MSAPARRAALGAVLAAVAGAAALAPACALIVGSETITGDLIDAGHGGATSTTTSSSTTTGSTTTGSTTTTTTGGACASSWLVKIDGKAGDVFLAVDEVSQHIFLAATVTGQVSVGAMPHPPKGGPLDTDILLVRYDENGVALWSRRFGTAGEERVKGLAFSAANRVIAAIEYQPAKGHGFGCSTGVDTGVDASASTFAAVVALDPTNGDCTSGSDIFFNPGSVVDLAVEPGSSDVWTAGVSYSNTLSIGHIVGPSIHGPALGGGSPPPDPIAIAVVDGVAVLAGGFSSSFADYQGTASFPSSDGTDALLVRFKAVAPDKVYGDGGVAFTGAGYQAFHRVTSDGDAIFAVGEAAESIDLGADGGALTSAGGRDVLVVKRGADLSPLWGARFGGVGSERGTVIAARSGRVLIAGQHTGGFSIGDPLAAHGGEDVFVAALDDAAAGEPLWACSFGGANDDLVKALRAVSGGLVITGTFSGPANFGQAIDGGGDAIFVAKLTGGS